METTNHTAKQSFNEYGIKKEEIYEGEAAKKCCAIELREKATK